MASVVVGPIICCRRPLSPGHIMLLYLSLSWAVDMLDDEIMTTNDMFALVAAQYLDTL